MASSDSYRYGGRSTGRDSGEGRSRGRLFIELGIIFAGVFGAFVAEDVRQQREDDRRATMTYLALLGEMETFSVRAPFVVAQMDSVVSHWESQRTAGERPPPPYYREPRAETPPTAIWEATLASGGVALLEPELFNQLAVFYNRLISVSDRYSRYNQMTEREVLPYLDDDPAYFYAADGRLRGLFRTHLDLLDEVRVEIDQLSEEALKTAGAIQERLEN